MVRLRSVSWMGWMGVAMVRLERSFFPLCVSIPLHWEIQGTQIVLSKEICSIMGISCGS